MQAAKEEELAESSALSAKEAMIEETRDKIHALDESVNELQQVLLVTSEELEKLEGRKEVLKERKKNAAQNQEQLEESVTHYTNKEAELKADIEKQSAVYDKLRAEVKRLNAQVKEKQQALSLHNENVEDKIEQLKSDYFELLNSQASIRNELQLLDDQMSQSAVQQARLTANNEKYLEERNDIAVRKVACEEELAAVEEDIHNQVVRFREVQTAYEQKKRQYEKKESALYQAYQFVQQARSKKDMLETMQGDFSGFYQGVKEVLKQKEQLGGIRGAVLELIATEQKYETAIEIALGAAAQHVVTDDEQAARKAIQYLKQNSFGRATFLPLTVMKPRQLQTRDEQTAQKHPSFLGTASGLVTYDAAYRNVIQNLLGTVLITEDLKGANELAKLLGHRYRIVTLEGDVVNPGGSMTGGAVKKKNNSLLGRSRELETVTARLAEMEEKTALLEKEVKTLKQAIQELEHTLSGLREDGEAFRTKQQDVKGRLYELEVAEKNINTHLELYDQEKASLTESSQKKRRANQLWKNS